MTEGSGAGSTVDLSFREWWDEIERAAPTRLDVALAAWRIGERERDQLRADLEAARTENHGWLCTQTAICTVIRRSAQKCR